MPIRVAVVEDDNAVCAATAEIIRGCERFELVWIAADLAHARAQLGRGDLIPLDLIVLDLGLPDGRGTALLPTIRARAPAAVVVAFTVFDDQSNVIEAIEAGVDGYLLKSADEKSLLETLDSAAAGESPISPAVAGFLLRRLRRVEQAAALSTKPDKLMALTPRERDVLEALARGYSYREAAELLGMRVNTVSHHVKSLYPKLASTSRSEAIFHALQSGIISLE